MVTTAMKLPALFVIFVIVALTGTPLLAGEDKRPPLAGHPARITFNDGHITEGTIASETRDSIRVGNRVIALADVATIDLAEADGKSSGTKNGFIIGALAGLALGAMGSSAASGWSEEANYTPNGPRVGPSPSKGIVSIVGAALIFGGIGAMIGHNSGSSRPRYTKRIVIAGTSIIDRNNVVR